MNPHMSMSFSLLECSGIYPVDNCSYWGLSWSRNCSIQVTFSPGLFTRSPLGKWAQLSSRRLQNGEQLCKPTVWWQVLVAWPVTKGLLTFDSQVFFLHLNNRDLAFFSFLFGLLLSNKGLHFHTASMQTIFTYANVFLVPPNGSTSSVPSIVLRFARELAFWIWSFKKWFCAKYLFWQTTAACSKSPSRKTFQYWSGRLTHCVFCLWISVIPVCDWVITAYLNRWHSICVSSGQPLPASKWNYCPSQGFECRRLHFRLHFDWDVLTSALSPLLFLVSINHPILNWGRVIM